MNTKSNQTMTSQRYNQMIETRSFNYNDFFNNTDGSLVLNDKDYDLKNVNNMVPTYSLDNKNGTVVTLGKVD